jgi:uncharacterized membrane protein (DUF485 family)
MADTTLDRFLDTACGFTWALSIVLAMNLLFLLLTGFSLLYLDPSDRSYDVALLTIASALGVVAIVVGLVLLCRRRGQMPDEEAIREEVERRAREREREG